MKPDHRNAVRIVVSLILMLGVVSLIWPSQGAREREQLDEAFPTSGRAKSVPISKKLIKLRFIVDGQHIIYAAQFDGGLIRIEKDGAVIYGFAPYIVDQAAETIAIRVFQISRIEKKKKSGSVVREHMEELQTLDAGTANDHHLTTYADSLSHFAIEIIDTRSGKDSTDNSIRPQSAGDECCLECNGLTTCSCAVSTNCGSCCHPTCCQLN